MSLAFFQHAIATVRDPFNNRDKLWLRRIHFGFKGSFLIFIGSVLCLWFTNSFGYSIDQYSTNEDQVKKILTTIYKKAYRYRIFKIIATCL